MCVIGYKPHGVEPISKEILQKCWKKNGDGAGYAIYQEDSQTWKYRKGFMKWRYFWKAFKKEKVTTDTCYIVHFRIKSAGAVTKGNTHPFILTRNYTKMKRIKGDSEHTLVFHNGTCGKGDGSASDTMSFIKKVIAPLIKYQEDKVIEDLLSKLLTDTLDRWLIVEGNSITRWGTWHEKDGVKYSNLLWDMKEYKPYKPTTPAVNPIHPINPRTGDQIKTGTGETYNWKKKWRNKQQNITPVLIERTGELHPDGTVTWDVDEITPTDEIITMCPYCYEDKYLTDSPFQSMGDTMCEKCGACFDEGTDVILLHDQELLASYEERVRAQKAGEL